ncbi:MAG: HAMP domain-containing sensor histidine kinase [Candidatus Limivivens sp.]|nr:HAMP domain-containing sensor histidine kinase [Candidatus Limivivens sp.]
MEYLDRKAVKQSRFPVFLFGIFFLILLLMSGIHTGLIVGMNTWKMNSLVQVITPMLYWGGVAAGLTLYTAWQIRRTYEVPMKTLADATSQVAQGDFSVYIPPLHTPEKLDYLDVMIMDFNKMVEELGSIETLKTDFFSNVSHEIKTPLAVIQSNAELLQKKDLPDEQQKECTEIILQATKRLSSLITNMLKLNKLEKQAIKPIPKKYDLCAQLCECALQFEHMWEDKAIELEADLEEHVVIEGDEELLAMVWTNLLSNAIKFTPSGGTITISQTSDDKKVRVSVADTGCGMDEETKRRVFDKFYQGDTSHATEGNGLGLALVKRILQLSDGSISVESAVGKGTAFTVELPVSLQREE